jgi:EmrB/QacA subfamily drug resistance transporter
MAPISVRSEAQTRTLFGVSARAVATSAVLLGLVVGAFEGTVVTTAMPSIARELRGVDLYGWVFSAYLVASMAGVLVVGKLADAFGRRPVFAAGMLLFLIGSVLCGSAQSIEALVLFRVVQGLGAGAIQPIAMTVTGDLYTLDERARIQAVFTSAWGLASVLGPVLGGWIVTHLSWRWVFFVNVPIGLLAVVVLLVAYRDPPRDRTTSLGVRGAVLGGLSAATLLLALDRGLSSVRLALLAVAALLGLAFVVEQRHSDAPVVARSALPDPVVRGGLIASLFAGGVLYTAAAFVPLWMTLHAEGTPIVAGLAVVPLLAGWALGSSFGVRVLVRYGMRASVVGGFGLASIGAVLLALSAHAGSPIAVAASLAVLGAGLGPAASTSLVAPQNRVPFRMRAGITSAVFATRALGGSISVAAVSALSFGDAAAFYAISAIVVGGFVAALVVIPATRLGELVFIASSVSPR